MITLFFNFNIVFITTLLLWLIGVYVFYITKYKKLGLIISGIGVVYLLLLIVYLWQMLDRPPLRTLGETRLWYSFLVPIVGYVLYFRWRMKWIIGYSFFLSSIFVLINYLTPENFNKALMPALQSIWFVPHVIVYMFAYAILSASMIIAIKGLYKSNKGLTVDNELDMADNVVYVGFAFLSFGLLFGAFWAKKAWGHYWTWDPKETWSFITWLFYLLYIHIRLRHATNHKLALWILALSFVFLLMCWFGISYLPAAHESVHNYTS